MNITSIFVNQSSAFAYNNWETEYNKEKLSLYAKGGYRIDNLNWNIAGNSSGTNPNVLSELSWSMLQIYQYKIGATIPVLSLKNNTISRSRYTYSDPVLDKQNLYFNVGMARGEIFSGKNQDSDYVGNNRTLEFSRSNNNGGSGNVRDYEASLNYELNFKYGNKWNYAFTPIVGYAQNEQNLRMTDGFQTVSVIVVTPNGTIIPPPAGKPFSGLNSTYDATWKGPFIGLGFSTSYNNKHKLSAAGQYHMVNYYAQANWNLRSNFQHPKSFEHNADGQGVTVDLEYGYKIFKNLSLNLNLNYKQFSTRRGTDRVFLSDGTTQETMLNKVEWNSFYSMIGFAVNF